MIKITHKRSFFPLEKKNINFTYFHFALFKAFKFHSESKNAICCTTSKKILIIYFPFMHVCMHALLCPSPECTQCIKAKILLSLKSPYIFNRRSTFFFHYISFLHARLPTTTSRKSLIYFYYLDIWIQILVDALLPKNALLWVVKFLKTNVFKIVQQIIQFMLPMTLYRK